MTFLAAFVRSPLAGAVGWALLHSLWQGAVAAAALAAVLLATRSPRVRYAAGCVAMIAMLGGLSVTLIRTLPQTRAEASHARVIRTMAVGDRSGFPGAVNPKLDAMAPWLPPFWMLGMALFYVRYAIGVAALHRLRRRGLIGAPPSWIEDLARLCGRLRVSRPVLLMESCLVDVPMVLGHLRPLILLPVGMLTGLPPEQVEAILAHELAHVCRHDYLVNALQRLVEGLLFYHPAVWWFSQVIRSEREKCCDDIAVAIRRNPHEYAVALASLEQHRCGFRVPAVSATGGNLVKRTRRLLFPARSNGAWAPFLAVVVLIAASAATVLAWPHEPSSNETSRYTRWLNEDVVYIIDDAERSAFEKLTTDAERDRFVEQFWERRNPTPGAAGNKFKEEHYRRIAYANEHFAASVAGWRTDRGHMYIAWGPPDDIEAHPTSRETAYGHEIWTYRHVEKVGDTVSLTFVDETGRGDYRLAPGNAR